MDFRSGQGNTELHFDEENKDEKVEVGSYKKAIKYKKITRKELKKKLIIVFKRIRKRSRESNGKRNSMGFCKEIEEGRRKD